MLASSAATCPWQFPNPLYLQVALPSQTRAISLAAESFVIPGAPDLIPEGDWVKVPGGNVVTAKGFKATGEDPGGL